ncbi:MAG TPA: tetratricopeptide repeat protein [Chthonomonadaceae bacterium]|nr:tetratricopeptide repeat protein [Chthonomonadaceae bacterium]
MQATYCRIEMFGGLRVWQGDTLHTRFRTQKAASLLAYLALDLHQAQSRERLLDLFWPDMPPEIGRTNLSTALTQLRKQFEPVGTPSGSLLRADRQQVWLHAEAVATDVAEFDRCMHEAARCERAAQKAELLQKAMDLYQGDLLPGSYEDWALREQSRCHSVYLQSLHQLERFEEEAGRYEAALALAQRALQADPYLEEAVQAQMRLYVRLKRPAVALQVYEEIQQRFQKELGALPSVVTRRLAERIRQDPNAALLLREQTQSAAPRVPLVAASLPSPVNALPASPPVSAPALPLQWTRFFGRHQELERLQGLLQAPGVRLVTLLGPGGAGKTRLGIEVAQRMTGILQERVWFVPLADLPDASLLPSALLRALRLPPLAQTDPLDRVAAALGAEPCLFVLDNFEHLLREEAEGKNETLMRGGTALVRILLERVPTLRCLVTSRQALRIGGEQEFALPPLTLPHQEMPTSLEALLANESVALYVDRARLARPDFDLTVSNAAAVSALCRKLEGMPLAIEMAAAWAKTLPPAKMLERLERQLDLLVSRRRDLPPRHQSLRATIEWSYDLLPLELQQRFIRLAVFRGGWSLEGAEGVVGEGVVESLAELQERSLILMEEHAAEPRYRMLETLREFGLEKLQEQGILDAIRTLHIRYYYNMADEESYHIGTPEEKASIDRLSVEYENLLEALGASMDLPQQTKFGIHMAANLSWFWMQRGRLAEGRNWLERFLERCPPAPTEIRACLLNAAGMLLLESGKIVEAHVHMQESVDIYRHLGKQRALASQTHNLGNSAHDLGDTALARRCWEEGLEIARKEGWTRMASTSLASLGELSYDEGDLERARALLEEAVSVRRPIGDWNYLGHDLGILGKVACRQGQLAQAEAFFAECLELRRRMEDRIGIITALEGIAGLARMQGDAERAVCLFAFTERARMQEQSLRPPNEASEIADHLEVLHTLLDAAAFDAAWQRGQRWTQEQSCLHAFSRSLS